MFCSPAARFLSCKQRPRCTIEDTLPNGISRLTPTVTTALRTKLGATLLIGVRTTHHCRNGLLPLPVAPSQSAEMTGPIQVPFSLCPGPSSRPYAIEDPIEYEHTHLRSLVEQVEIGIDARDFLGALRAALRQAPDVIVVGEMRDPETARIAVSAAETGHLVFSTLHTTDVASTVSRIADSFPSERQNTIRQELAMALAAVLTQTLLPSRLGGRVPAAELLLIGYGARQHIRRNALQHLHQEITITRKMGSFTLEESLSQLVQEGHISREDARICARHPDDLETLLKTVRNT